VLTGDGGPKRLQFVQVTRLECGYLVDPTLYLAELDALARRLPAGAAQFALSSGHYDMTSEHSIKDLKIVRIEVVDAFAALTATIELAYNDIPEVPRLTLTYTDVLDISLTVRSTFELRPDWVASDIRKLGDVLTDELLPHDHGCTHVVETIHGRLSVVAADVVPKWSDGHA
jgi:hypothetical protein